jgi:hypothetical protein
MRQPPSAGAQAAAAAHFVGGAVMTDVCEAKRPTEDDLEACERDWLDHYMGLTLEHEQV